MSAETTVSNRWLFCPTVFPGNFPLRWMLPREQLRGKKRIRYSSPLQPFKFDSHLFHQPLRGNLKSSCQRHHDIKRRGARPFFQSRDVTVVLQELRGCHLTRLCRTKSTRSHPTAAGRAKHRSRWTGSTPFSGRIPAGSNPHRCGFSPTLLTTSPNRRNKSTLPPWEIAKSGRLSKKILPDCPADTVHHHQ